MGLFTRFLGLLGYVGDQDKRQSSINLDNIFPLVVPASYYVKGTWELPHFKLPDQSFILTWVIFGEEATMSYITHEQYKDLTNNHGCWQQKTFENLRRSMAVLKCFSPTIKCRPMDSNYSGFAL